MSRVHVLTKVVVLPLLLVLVASVPSDAQEQKKKSRSNRASQRRRGSRSSPTALLRMSQVQAELKLTDKQKADLQKIARPSLRDASREERTKKLAEYRKNADAKIKEILEEGQQKRLSQLVLQRQGYRALGTAAVAKKLGLSKEQGQKIQAVLNPSREGRSRTNFRDLSDEERRKLMAQSRERSAKREKAVLALLNDKQKESFKKMKGEKFEFPSRRRRSQ